jgi:hypothetical protein
VSEPYTFERQWQRPTGTPVWRTREELFAVLAKYRRWYEEGRSDTEISTRIRMIQLQHNPHLAMKKGKR